MARRKEQTRRRSELVAAAGRAILERGVVGLRIRDVAEEAGLSAGSVSYYYRELEDLLLDVHADAVDRFYWARAAAIADVEDPPQRLSRLVTAGLPASAGDLLCRVLYEIHLHAARSSAHAALLTSLWDREVSLYDDVLADGRDLGVFRLVHPARDIAENAVALEDAYGLHIVARNAHVQRERARDLVLGYLAAETGISFSDVELQNHMLES